MQGPPAATDENKITAASLSKSTDNKYFDTWEPFFSFFPFFLVK